MDDFEHIYRAYFRDVELYPLAGEGRGFRRTMAAGAVLILAIELLQLVFGRAFDINDVILNLAGVAVSAGVFRLIRK